MDGTFYLSAFKAGTALCLRIISSVYYSYIAIFIFFAASAFYEISAHKTYFVSWEHTEIFLRRLFHKVFSFDINFTGEWNLSASQFRIFQVVWNIQFFYLSFRIVVDHQFYRI